MGDGEVRKVSSGGIVGPGGVAVLERADGGESVFVADFFTLREFEGADGGLRRNAFGFFSADAPATPCTVAADGQNLLVTSWLENVVQVYDPVAVEVVESHSDFGMPLNAIRFQGDLVVAEMGTGSVVLASGADPSLETRVTLAEGLAVPAGLAATEDDLFVCDQATGTLLQLVANGQRLDEPVQIAAGLQAPEGIAVDHDGTILVVEAGAGRLSRVNVETGRTSLVADDLDLGFHAPPNTPPTWLFNDVAVGPSGSIYVTADVANVVYRITPTMETRTPEEVFASHRKAIETGDFAALIADYAEDATILTAGGAATGREEIAGFFQNAFAQYPNLIVSFDEVTVSGDMVLLQWSGTSDSADITHAVATFLMSDGHIQRQVEWWIAEPK
jgi:ketosteroid isomerase-like protein